MKKVMFAAVAVLALASCKKDYVCKYKVGETSMEQNYSKLDKDAKSTAESQCKLLGGTFSAK